VLRKGNALSIYQQNCELDIFGVKAFAAFAAEA